jgi:cell shape-determining protein MreD
MRTLLAVPFFAILVILQTAVVSRLPLLRGFPDLVLLALIAWSLNERVTTAWQWTVVAGFIGGFISAAPGAVPMIGYIGAVAVGRLLQQRVWKTPLLAMFLTTLLGTFFFHGITILYLTVSGSRISVSEAINIITIPSVLLNLILALPIYALMKEIAEWLYPVKIEV